MAYITMHFDGLEELIEAFNALADDSQIQAVEEKITTRCRDLAKTRMRGRIPKSANNAKSGKKGYRPGGHAADNIPSSTSTSGGNTTATVGWQTIDKTDYFYMKFVEWGTYRMQPRDFLYNTLNECWADFDTIAEAEIKSFVDAHIQEG